MKGVVGPTCRIHIVGHRIPASRADKPESANPGPTGPMGEAVIGPRLIGLFHPSGRIHTTGLYGIDTFGLCLQHHLSQQLNSLHKVQHLDIKTPGRPTERLYLMAPAASPRVDGLIASSINPSSIFRQ
ncbi:unnamed protein product [Protopolystoma xenopodis]|uniref:Uncharacterized protein n=1 Tax=Protopolystoma xenopodis TaxID=117903 RepID=A0A3S5BPG7_9PLAT|nr:unnamed protein product [Protopolystoma xenopodis]